MLLSWVGFSCEGRNRSGCLTSRIVTSLQNKLGDTRCLRCYIRQWLQCGVVFYYRSCAVLFRYNTNSSHDVCCDRFSTFVAEPSIRLTREIWLARTQNVQRFAKQAAEGPGNLTAAQEVPGFASSQKTPPGPSPEQTEHNRRLDLKKRARSWLLTVQR